MDRLILKKHSAKRRAHRVRTVIRGNSELPRLSVHISNRHVLAHVIDDVSGKTLVYVTSAGQKAGTNLTEKATWVGTQLAAKAKQAKVVKVAYDRGAKRYHGRIKALAEAARAGGMEF